MPSKAARKGGNSTLHYLRCGCLDVAQRSPPHQDSTHKQTAFARVTFPGQEVLADASLDKAGKCSPIVLVGKSVWLVTVLLGKKLESRTE